MKALCAMLFCAIGCGAAVAADPATREWDFVVRLDGKVVGSHRFVIDEIAGGERVTSQARFDVKVLGLTVYRYRHSSHEVWRDGCLARIDASTEDDGKLTEVHGSGTQSAFTLDAGEGAIAGCLMTFAYWNADLTRQTRLLDPGTGRIVPVRIERVSDGRRWRIAGLPQPIEIEWDERRWVALDTFVSGHHLTYRLQ